MTRGEIAELERLLAAWRAARGTDSRLIARTRRRLETALVRHADALIAAAKARQSGVPHPLEPDPPMAAGRSR